MEEWNRLVQRAKEIDAEELKRAVQELIETFDEEQGLKSEDLHHLSPEAHRAFPPQLYTRADQVKNDAKPCPHCRGRSRDAQGKICEACKGTGEIKPNHGTT